MLKFEPFDVVEHSIAVGAGTIDITILALG